MSVFLNTELLYIILELKYTYILIFYFLNCSLSSEYVFFLNIAKTVSSHTPLTYRNVKHYTFAYNYYKALTDCNVIQCYISVNIFASRIFRVAACCFKFSLKCRNKLVYFLNHVAV